MKKSNNNGDKQEEELFDDMEIEISDEGKIVKKPVMAIYKVDGKVFIELSDDTTTYEALGILTAFTENLKEALKEGFNGIKRDN